MLLVHFHQPVVFTRLVLALVSPARDPFAGGFVVDELLSPLLIGQSGTGLGVVFANALLASEQLPFRRGLGGRERLVAGEGGGARREGEEDTVLGGRGDLAGGEELVQERLGAIAGGGFQCIVERFGRGPDEGVGVQREKVAKVEGVWRWL